MNVPLRERLGLSLLGFSGGLALGYGLAMVAVESGGDEVVAVVVIWATFLVSVLLLGRWERR